MNIVDIFSLFFCMISDEDVDGIATTIGTIPILRQHMDWVGGFRKCPVLTFSTVFMLTWWMGESQNVLT